MTQVLMVLVLIGVYIGEPVVVLLQLIHFVVVQDLQGVLDLGNDQELHQQKLLGLGRFVILRFFVIHFLILNA